MHNQYPKAVYVNVSPIAMRLKEARLRAKVSQARLGVLAQIDEETASTRMNQYERGSHVPPYKLLLRCAEILRVPVEYFYAKTDEVAKLLLHFHLMDDDQKVRLFSFIDGFDLSESPIN